MCWSTPRDVLILCTIFFIPLFVYKINDNPINSSFYGAIFWEGDLWLFMEIMDSSLDNFYKKAYSNPDKDSENAIPEAILGRIASSIVEALEYLYKMKIIHRDVKPSNISDQS